MMYDNSATKGCWAKNKTLIGEGIQTEVLVNMDRKLCKTMVKNSIEKRPSTIKNVYNCENDHQFNPSRNEINAIDCPNEEPSAEQIIFVCGIDLVINYQELMQSSLITPDESIVISPNTTINESRHEPKKNRGVGEEDANWNFSTPKYPNTKEESSLMTYITDMSQMTEISTRIESSDSMLKERSRLKPKTIDNERMETSTRNESSDSILGERSRCKIKIMHNIQSS